ncbi:DNA repair protein REV1-like isoform X2 [Salvia splendens]|uniref:DNA repair protein REV1-like isoform X2 n=1 Tax=Salvia splendens TaxID=180675 RepID=UPI001C28076F|nr:DNA repair protein REV1-like isoform X2 [Salvia splendens]
MSTFDTNHGVTALPRHLNSSPPSFSFLYKSFTNTFLDFSQFKFALESFSIIFAIVMSSNSASKSKRSLKSTSANPSSSDGKRKKTAQKTLGMAWGANSRSGFRKSPFTDVGSYMAVKNQKLHEQFAAAASSSSCSGSSSGNIFSGVSIFVDGYTVPSSQELRGYMLKYGGRFENYFSRHRVTHIICSNLPDSKIKNLRAFSGGLPIVKPAWLLESVAANKLLSWTPYQLDQLAAENCNQAKLSAFFTLQCNETPKIANISVDDCDNQLFIKKDEGCASLEQAESCNEEEIDLVQLKTDRVMSEGPSCSVESSCEVKGLEQSDCSPSDMKISDLEYKSSPCKASVSHCSNSLDNFNSCEASCSRNCLPTNQLHSTLSDPNFVENYFKSSRLHFIGTWRHRYRKKFPSLSNGITFGVSNLYNAGSSLKTGVANEQKVVIHIDMDCFFVSVVIRNHPELQGKPVAVCHSDNPRGTAEISSANYPAREYGVRAGMFVKDAKIRCPQLAIVAYDFRAYEMVADQFYDILHNHCNKVQAVSCDEAFLDVSDSKVGDYEILASIIRKEILDTTGCTASAGIAENMLMARLATRTAKPDGQFHIPPGKVDDYLFTLPVKELPGIGHVLEEKLKKKQIRTCGQLRPIAKESLQKDFGMKTGEMLWNYSRGIDSRLVGLIQESKSVGADVNWGVRFNNANDVQHFLTSLCKEVALRLQGCGVQGRTFTLKIKKKKSDAGEPVKYMGHGDCENLSHAITIPMATDDVGVLQRLATQLFGHFHIDVGDIRGVGLQVSKLEGAGDSKRGNKRNSILSWVSSTSAKEQNQNPISDLPKCGESDAWRTTDGVLRQPGSSMKGSSIEMQAGLSSSETGIHNSTGIPPLQDLDVAVIESLPPEVVSEINEMYGGKLLGFISASKNKIIDTNINDASTKSCEGVAVEDMGSVSEAHLLESNIVATDKILRDIVMGVSKVMGCDKEEVPDFAAPATFSRKDIMPSSLSQVDSSVLQELPEEFRKDIIEHLGHHQRAEFVKGAINDVSDKQTKVEASDLSGLWVGNPPKWVKKFQISNCGLLTIFAEIYLSGSGGCLSSLLQCLMSRIFVLTGVGTDGFGNAVGWLHELFKQYIDLKITTDVEEIYVCICLLRRLTGRFEFLLQVYNSIIPHLQSIRLLEDGERRCGGSEASACAVLDLQVPAEGGGAEAAVMVACEDVQVEDQDWEAVEEAQIPTKVTPLSSHTLKSIERKQHLQSDLHTRTQTIRRRNGCATRSGEVLRQQPAAPSFYTDVKLNSERVDPPPPVTDPLIRSCRGRKRPTGPWAASTSSAIR